MRVDNVYESPQIATKERKSCSYMGIGERDVNPTISPFR